MQNHLARDKNEIIKGFGLDRKVLYHFSHFPSPEIIHFDFRKKWKELEIIMDNKPALERK
jgi:hypothetical protein